ncbi:gluconate transporter [Phaeodactylibacter luteus]|uniref:Gluconate transporter n=2 Tax=Phaeodactylibacter luteus TaxID=1564516 RepID=A0A5C6S725_9BACT|nr:gluconate transporter [Phaeodactylibacter luteus]
MTMTPIMGTLAGIALLLALILRFKLPAFLSLLIASMVAGILGGLPAAALLRSMQEGMGGTLGFVATVVGLGAIFGSLLEQAGGPKAIASFLLQRFGAGQAPLAMVLTGFVVAIPVFFDVAFIILVPIVYALQRRTGESLLKYGIPLLAGLAATHTFIPPTPGPIAVADILGADLGWVILAGALAGLPAVLVAGLFYGRYISRQIKVPAPPAADEGPSAAAATSSPGPFFAIIGLPIVLILAQTISGSLLPAPPPLVVFLGHPFTALLLANLLAWYWLGIKKGKKPAELLQVSAQSLQPAGSIILLTGAGGVFKQVLVDTGAGEQIASGMAAYGLPVILFAFLSAALVRVAQGSATVAMITGASLCAPLLAGSSPSPGQLAALAIATASGASVLSHVNDSGFWLVKSYLGLDEKQTFQSWTVMITLLALTGFAGACLLYWIF